MPCEAFAVIGQDHAPGPKRSKRDVHHRGRSGRSAYISALPDIRTPLADSRLLLGGVTLKETNPRLITARRAADLGGC